MPKLTDSITLTQDNLVSNNANNNVLRLKFPTSVTYKNKCIGFNNGSIYYSWANVGVSYNNQFFQYIFTDGVTYNVTVPAGNYSIVDLSNYLQAVMTTNNHYMLDSKGNKVFFISWAPNLTYYRTTFVCTQVVVPSGGSNPNALTLAKTPQLLISNNGFSTLLGISAGTYPSSQAVAGPSYNFNGTLVPAISPVTLVNINCSIAENRTNQNSKQIYQFQPQLSFGNQLSLVPSYPLYYKIIDGTYQSIEISLTDNKNVALPIQDTTAISITLILTDID